MGLGFFEDILDASVGPIVKPVAQAAKSVGGALGIKPVERIAGYVKEHPTRAAALAYGGYLAYPLLAGAGAGGVAGAAGGGAAAGTSAATYAAYAALGLNAYQALSARKAAQEHPEVRPVSYMPDPNDPMAQQARRRKAAEIARRSGRASTILSDASETLG